MDSEALRQKLSHLGLWGALCHYGFRAHERYARVSVFWVLCLAELPWEAESSEVSRFECGEMDPDRLRRAALEGRSGLTPESVEAALARGEVCFGAFEKDSTLVSHLWIAHGPAHLRGGVFVSVGAGWGYSRWAFTLPAYRGLRLHAALKRLALEAELQRRGRGILSLVEAANRESLRAGRRLGCRRVGLSLVAGVGGRTWVASSPGARRYGVELAFAPRRASVGESHAG